MAERLQGASVRHCHREHSELEDRERLPRAGKFTPEHSDIGVGRTRGGNFEDGAFGVARAPTMASEPYSVLPQSSSDRRRRKDHHRDSDELRRRRRRKSRYKEDTTESSIHRVSPHRPRHSQRPSVASKEDDESTESEDSTTEVDTTKEPRKRKVRVIYITEEEAREDRRRERKVRERSKEQRSRPHPTRRKSVAEPPGIPSAGRTELLKEPRSEARPTLHRTSTTASNATSSKRSSFMGSFFGPPAKQYHEPEKLVECLTCLSDDIPRSKSAKLKCGHRMCHSCLRRIFKLSITDPQHMPPKCCTADHIPLKHVERLFDINFKRTWNKKFQEFSTKNRIYCPGRRCGEWIKPSNIHKEDGRKYGKCSRCKTKVCCLCNGKWHGSKDCPKDEETNRLLQAAKDAGWQRCYSCRTLVELKEGCNHMTCRCTAEFCMICGLKWKTCNCPWFNYDAVEADRLNHMQVPADVENEPQGRPPRIRRPRPPNNYHEEIINRRRQERMDEELARRLQRAAIDDEEDDYQGGIGDIHGVGNNAGHFMNQDYVRAAHDILTANFDQANFAANAYVRGLREARGGPPPLRRQSVREQAYNSAPGRRAAERIVPRRTRTDYESEVAVHAPSPRRLSPDQRPAVLAGLTGRAGNRVNAWRTHVEPGVTPAEGVLSI